MPLRKLALQTTSGERFLVYYPDVFPDENGNGDLPTSVAAKLSEVDKIKDDIRKMGFPRGAATAYVDLCYWVRDLCKIEEALYSSLNVEIQEVVESSLPPNLEEGEVEHAPDLDEIIEWLRQVDEKLDCVRKDEADGFVGWYKETGRRLLCYWLLVEIDKSIHNAKRRLKEKLANRGASILSRNNHRLVTQMQEKIATTIDTAKRLLLKDSDVRDDVDEFLDQLKDSRDRRIRGVN